MKSNVIIVFSTLQSTQRLLKSFRSQVKWVDFCELTLSCPCCLCQGTPGPFNALHEGWQTWQWDSSKEDFPEGNRLIQSMKKLYKTLHSQPVLLQLQYRALFHRNYFPPFTLSLLSSESKSSRRKKKKKVKMGPPKWGLSIQKKKTGTENQARKKNYLSYSTFLFCFFFFKYAVNNFWAFLNFFFSPQNWLTFLTYSTRQTGK